MFSKTYIAGGVGSQVFLHSGEKVSIDYAASMIFWTLQIFTSGFADAKDTHVILSNRMYLTESSLNMLKRFCPSVYETLSNFDLVSLSYASRPVITYFVDSKSDDEIKLLCLAVATSKMPFLYIRVYLCTLFNEIANLLKETKGSQRQIEPLIDATIHRLNIRLFLTNSEKFLAFLEPLITRYND